MTKEKKVQTFDDDELEHPLPPDGGWGWVVMVASFFSNLFVDGVLYTFGILLTYLAYSFPEVGKAQISLAGSLLGGIYLIVGPFVGGLVNKFGCRPVAITGAVISAVSFWVSTFSKSILTLQISYGIFGGIGFGLLYLPSIVMVGMYFDRRRAMATGIAVCGSGLGTFIFAPLAAILCDYYGWRGANFLIGALLLNGIACAMVYRPLKAKKKNKKLLNEVKSDSEEFGVADHDGKGDEELPDARPLDRADILYSGSVTNLAEYTANPNMREYVNSTTNIPKSAGNEDGRCAPAFDVFKKMFDFSLLLSPTFILICLAGVFGFMGFYSPFVYLTDYASLTAGASPRQASILVSVIGLSNTISRILAGWLADRPWADSALIHNLSLIVAGLSTCFLPFFNEMVAFFVYSVIFGFSIAAFIALRSIVICDLMGVQKLTNAFGIVALFQGVALLLGTPLSGAIFDRTGSYQLPFIVSGCIMMFGGIICLPIRKVNRWEINRTQKRNIYIPVCKSLVVEA